ncbi:dephospho-CoA kinase [Pseudomonadota bacterium]
MLVIGLTGGVASGKTFISSYLKEQGCVVFDTDEEVHKLLEDSRTSVFKEVKKTFPDATSRGEIDRQKLGNIVFSDKERLRRLENIVHPKLTEVLLYFLEKQKEIEKKQNTQQIIILDAALLFQASWDKYCNYTILLKLDKKIQKERYLERKNTDLEKLEKIIDNQEHLDERFGDKANFIVDTSGDKNDILVEIDKVLEKIQKHQQKNA